MKTVNTVIAVLFFSLLAFAVSENPTPAVDRPGESIQVGETIRTPVPAPNADVVRVSWMSGGEFVSNAIVGSYRHAEAPTSQEESELAARARSNVDIILRRLPISRAPAGEWTAGSDDDGGWGLLFADATVVTWRSGGLMIEVRVNRLVGENDVVHARRVAARVAAMRAEFPVDPPAPVQ